MKKGILLVGILLMALPLFCEGIQLEKKGLTYGKGAVDFSLLYAIDMGYDMQNVAESVKLVSGSPDLKLEELSIKKLEKPEGKYIAMSGRLVPAGKGAYELDNLTLKISYELCGEDSNICLMAKTIEETMPLDGSKLKGGAFSFSPWTLAFLFLSGVATSFTPCVFPLIPLIFGFIGASGKSVKKALSLSVVMALTMSLVYALLGVAAALSGKVFGTAMSSPWFFVGAGLLMALMGISMSGLLPFKTPASVSKALTGYKGKGYLSAMMMGLFLGALGAPCIAPVLISVLTYVSSTQNGVAGGVMLFTYAMGIGTVFTGAGILSLSLGKRFPQGEWMGFVKTLFSYLIIGGGCYFIDKGLQTGWLVPLFLLFLGGWLVKQAWSCKPLVRVGFVILALASWVVPFQKVYTTALEYGQKRSDIAWERDLTQAQSVAKGDGRLLFIDFSADWCDNCKKLEKELEVLYPNLKEKLVFVKVDMTKSGEVQDTMAKKYNIIGLPGVVIQCPQGKHIQTFFGFPGKKELEKALADSFAKGENECGG